MAAYDSASSDAVARAGARRRALIIAGAAALVVVLGIVGSLLIPRVFGPPSTAIVTVELTQQPTAGIWQIRHPLLDEAAADDILMQQVFTIAQNAAVVYWSVVPPSVGTATMSALSLIDTRTGAVHWTLEDAPALDGIVGWTDSTIVGFGVDGIFSFDRASGELLVTTSDWQAEFTTSFGVNGVVEGVVLASDGSALAALDAHDLSLRWTVDDTRGFDGVAGDLAIVDGAAYEVETGKPARWVGDPDLEVVEFNGVLLAQSDDTIVGLADDGAELWRYPVEGDGMFTLPLAGTIVFGDSEGDGVATALDVATGDTLWDHAYSNASSYRPLGSDGRYLVPTTPTTVSGVDALTGEDLFTFEVDNPSLTVIGSTTNVFYESGGAVSPLRARSWANGEVLWAIDSLELTGSLEVAWYDFSVAGGNLIGTLPTLFTDMIRDVDSASVIGVG